jgi:lysophospholipase L1-like esterase
VRLNELVAREIDGRDKFHLVGTEDWLQALPGGEFNPDYRADGVHYTQLGADEFAKWLIPQVLAAKDGG